MPSRRLPAAVFAAAQMLAVTAWAQAPDAPALPPIAVPSAEPLPVEEPAPEFQPVRPVDEPTPQPEPEPAPSVPPTVSTPAAEPAPPVPVAVPVPAADQGLPAWAMSLVLLAGAFLAGLFGVMTAALLRRGEARRRRRAVATTLATELETRLQAFDAVPLPPNAEAGVFFVSAVISLAGIDAGFRAAQSDLHLLPGKLASHISVHYAAVRRVADFVKGQSLAAAVRMMQANRMGGHPCPDAGTMREAHVELGAAFRGLDKLVAALRAAEAG
ncbi:MAG: hypothetical protein AB1918_14580 [Pseudomonadota bacterium]